MSALYQVTSRNAVVTIQDNLGIIIPTPVVLQGWALDNFMQVEQTTNVEVEKSLDNNTVGWVRPVVMSGKLMVLPGSIAQQTLETLQTFQTNSGILVACTLTVSFPSFTTNVTYSNFIVTNVFGGYPIGKRVEDVEVQFKAEVPGTAAINSLVQLGLATIGLI